MLLHPVRPNLTQPSAQSGCNRNKKKSADSQLLSQQFLPVTAHEDNETMVFKCRADNCAPRPGRNARDRKSTLVPATTIGTKIKAMENRAPQNDGSSRSER